MIKNKKSILYEKDIYKYGTRKWYNPFRWIIGRKYCKLITLPEVFK